jgi:hypothetical protein
MITNIKPLKISGHHFSGVLFLKETTGLLVQAE